MENNVIDDELMDFIMDNFRLANEDVNISDDLLQLYINMLCQNILVKTNRRSFPQDLKYVVIDMLKDKFDSTKSNNDIQSIQSMSETGRTVNFGVDNITQTKLNLLAQKQIEEYDVLIKRYKLLYRTGGSNE